MEFRDSPGYMALVEQLREKYHRREEDIAGLLENRDAAGLLARGDRIRAQLCRHILDEDLEKVPLVCRLEETLVFPGYRVEKRVVSGVAGMCIPVTLYLPDNRKRKHPAVVVTMGHWLHGKAREDNQRLCANLVLRGAAAITFDPVFQGERCRYTESQLEEMFGAIPEDMWMVGLHMQAGNLAYLLEKNVAALFIREAVQVVDYLVSREDIDSARILAAGQSGGGTQACYLGAVDERIRGVIPVQCLSRLAVTLEGGIGDCEQSFWGISESEGVEQGDLLWAVLPKPVFHCAGQYDYFDVDGACAIAREMTEVYDVLGQPGGYQLALADCGHALTREVREQIYSWVCDQFGLPKIPAEVETAVLPPEKLVCRDPAECSVGPVDIYRQLLERKKVLRPKASEEIREQLRRKIGAVSRCGEAKHDLKKGNGKKLLIYVGPEGEQLPVTEHSVLRLDLWGMESAWAKKKLGYDLETCMFNAAAVLGRDLCAERVCGILAALEDAQETTGTEETLVVGQDAGCVPVLVAACISPVPVTVYLAEGLDSLDDLFAGEGYFLKETEMLPGILEIGDLPKLRELAGAKVFRSRRRDGRCEGDTGELWQAVESWLKENE